MAPAGPPRRVPPMRARRTREQWVSLVAMFERSALSAARFCAVRGLTLATFRWWRSELRRGGALATAAEPVRLLAVEVAEPRIAGAAPVVVAFSGVEVRAVLGTDPGYLGALVAEIRSRC